MELTVNTNNVQILAVADISVAHNRYDSFVDIHFLMLTIVDFVQK